MTNAVVLSMIKKKNNDAWINSVVVYKLENWKKKSVGISLKCAWGKITF